MWVARDKTGVLYIYNGKPVRQKEAFSSCLGYCSLKDTPFPYLKWEDEPIEVEIVKKEKV